MRVLNVLGGERGEWRWDGGGGKGKGRGRGGQRKVGWDFGRWERRMKNGCLERAQWNGY